MTTIFLQSISCEHFVAVQHSSSLHSFLSLVISSCVTITFVHDYSKHCPVSIPHMDSVVTPTGCVLYRRMMSSKQDPWALCYTIHYCQGLRKFTVQVQIFTLELCFAFSSQLQHSEYKECCYSVIFRVFHMCSSPSSVHDFMALLNH
jgi:hypothetical protein